MNELKNEIISLRNQLERSDIAGSAVKRQTLVHLNRLIKDDEEAFEITFAELKRFWLNSVDWCSELSKQLEKLVIMQDELTSDKL